MARRLTLRARAAAALAVTAVTAVLGALSGCANQDGLALARQACQHVDISLAMYRSAQSSPSSPESARQLTKALQQLRTALPIAAKATGEAQQWQALMATLAESTRVPESDLVSALQAQCAATSGP